MKVLIISSLCLLFSFSSQAQTEAQQLATSLKAETPILEDLHELCDQIGGRVTGTAPNEASVDWCLKKFEQAGVEAYATPFEMPRKWAEKAARAKIRGDVRFKPKIACRAFSTGTPKGGLEAELVFVGNGSTPEFEKVKDKVRGNFVLIKTGVMTDLTKLFLEYINAVEIESNAKQYGALGVIYMSSREKKLLYRHLTSYGIDNDMPMVVMARDDATRCERLLARGKKLLLNIELDVVDEGAFFSKNVFGIIPGTDLKEELIVFGAHLDSWGLGTGANDNGANVNMMIDIARQMTALGIKPRRTIVFALWNGEEQGMLGSYAYTQQELKELDKVKVAMSIDIGSGLINGFFTNGRPEMIPFITELLKDFEGSDILEHTDAPIVGTDNYDFLAQGIPNLVGKHHVHNYCSDYHSESDTYDKVNQENLKQNTALVGYLALQLANADGLDFPRHDRAQVQSIIDKYELKAGMTALCLWKGWMDGSRGVAK